MVETLRFSKIGAEDLALGTGQFEAELSDGRRVALTKINLGTFSTDLIANGVFFADGASNLTQNALFTYNNLTSQLILQGGLAVGPVSGVTAALGQLHAVNDGAAQISIENTVSDDGDTKLVYYKEGIGQWNITVDDSNSNYLQIGTSADPTTTPHMMFSSSGTNSIVIGSNADNTGSSNGLTINQQGSDNEILSCKSTDVAHGVTTLTETDTYLLIEKVDGGAGGGLVQGFSETQVGLKLWGIGTTTDTTESTAAIGAVVISGSVKSGTNTTALAATDNLAVFETNGTARLIVKGDGDVEADGTVTSTSFDDHNDIELLEAYKTIGNPDHRQTLGDWVNDHLETLEAGGVIKRYDSGWFVSTRGLNGLLVDAIRQIGTRLDALESDAGMGA